MRIALLVIGCLLLAGCGGSGGGGGGNPIPPGTGPALDFLFAYFGVMGNQIAEVGKTVNAAMLAGWGDWSTPVSRQAIADRQVAEIRASIAQGVTKIILFVDYLIWTPAYAYRGPADLTAFINSLKSQGLWGYVCALYPIDEPDMQAPITNSVLTQVCTDLKTFGLPLAVIYGDHAMTAIGSYDWIGIDRYGDGAGVLSKLPAIAPTQRYLLVPGGASPWKNDPQPFIAYARAHRQVVGIIAFIYGSNWGGTGNQGIHDNGMFPAYSSVLTQVTAP